MGGMHFDPNHNAYNPQVLVGGAIFFIFVSIFVVGLRFYARLVSWAKFGADDWMTIPTMFICIAVAITQIIAATAGGLGSHTKLVDGKLAHTPQLYALEKARYASQLMTVVNYTMVKLCVLLFYRRIFCSNRTFYIINSILIGIVIAWGIAFTFVYIFLCIPISAGWDQFEYEQTGSCLGATPVWATRISDIVLDAIILIVPLPLVIQLNMRVQQKVAVIGIVMLGIIVVVSSIVQTLYFSWEIDFISSNPETYFNDPSWYLPATLFWALTENVTGLVGACLPTYAPLLKRLMKGRINSVSSLGSAGKQVRRRVYGTPARYDGDHDLILSPTSPIAPNKVYVRRIDGDLAGSVPENKIAVDREFRIEDEEAQVGEAV
ncbi:hypothetical protein GGR56DRAFT_673986 [Xylariaceae sp. FL0804]|nr:hypothetical protein GGR56DRAFT_673986 [Xylariaceae sp. FL0804]